MEIEGVWSSALQVDQPRLRVYLYVCLLVLGSRR